MFDSLVVTRTQKPGARAFLGFPAALALHAAVGVAYFTAALYASPVVTPPPYKTFVGELPATPVTLVRRAEVERRPQSAPQTQKRAPQENPFVAPFEPPTGVSPAPDLPADPSGPPVSDDAWVVDDPALGDDDPLLGGRAPLMKVFEMLEPPRLLHQVSPTYPRALEVMGVSGRVVLELEVDEMGAVAAVRVLSSPHPLLAQAAEEAVRQWRYSRPLAPGGGAARVVLTVNVTFKMR